MVTESWLSEIGGWQAMKSAREYLRVGAVAEISQEGRTFRGLVGSGQRKFRATLIAGEGKNAEVKCACPDAQRGLVCSHALAVALAAISPGSVAVPPKPPGSATPAHAGAQGQGRAGGAAPAKPPVREADIPAGEFTIYIGTDQLSPPPAVPAGRGPAASRPVAEPSVPIFLKFQPGGVSRDSAVARWMLERDLPVQSIPMRVPASELGSLLSALIGHPRVVAGMPSKDTGKNSPPNVPNCFVSSQLSLKIQTEYNKSAQTIRFRLLNSQWKPIHPQASSWLWSAKDRTFASLPHELPPLVLGFVATLMQSGQANQPIRWVAENLAALCQVLTPEADDDTLRRLRVLPAQPVFQLRLDGSLRRAEAALSALLPDNTTPATPAAYPVQDRENPFLFHARNLALERSAQRQLEDAGFKSLAGFSGSVSSGRSSASSSGSAGNTGTATYELKGDREILQFLSSDLPRFKRTFQIVEGDGWRNATRGLAIIRPKVRPPAPEKGRTGRPGDADTETSGRAGTADWLSLEVAYEAADGFSIPRSEVLRLIRSGKRDLTGKDGRRYLLDTDSCEDLEDMVQDMESHFEGGSRLAVRSRQAEVLEGFVDRPELLALHACPPLADTELHARLGNLGQMLRPYQLEGVRWMERHSRTRGGGILADEMGLGKTVQTLSLLRVLKKSPSAAPARGDSKQPPGPALVICPTSLLNNWADEAARFTPELKTHISHDSDRRESLTKLTEFDVIFTSYALIVRDLEYFTKVNFSAVILDEASYIRNPDTATAKAVRQLRAGCRFALTGTPVENSVRDLWSVFEFLVPRQLPSREDFQERFVKPLSGADPSQARPVMERLRRLIRPNLLRRTKREVAKDLPEKIEKVLYCELSGAQREVYQRLLDEGREEIRQARRRAGQGSARMTMFTVLLRLRQVCNDLRLVGIQGLDGLSPAELSGKWPVLEELLEETLAGGHKALLFSQFVGMLKLVKGQVTEQGTSHSYLDGSTQDRAGEVAAFQTDPERKLFLISLKAGGYGLNLTAADEVILIDPWWNPAVEAQAIDRAHRIGQGRPVTAYRLITRGTVEEKILKLQAQKRAIMDMTLEDDATVMSGLTDDDLEAILE